MLRMNRMFTIFLLVALLVSACQPIAAPAPQLSPAHEGLRPDAPEYAKHGPFWVGYRSLVIGEGTDHPLEAGLWYPALNPRGVKEEVTYTVNTKIPVEGMNATAPIYGHALLGAEIDAAAAPYPLVIYSHGFAANAAWVNALLEHYASYGFIVLAPEHIEQFDFDWTEMPNSSIDRPGDIKQVLDDAEQSAASGGDLAGLIDMQQVAVVGHSYGAYTALAMAGAQYDLDAFNARCAALAPEDPNIFYCDLFMPREAEMAARAGLDPMPEGLWPSFGDPRVTAIIPMAGDSYLFDKAGLSKITVPMMAIGGTADTGTPYEWGSRPAYDYASSAGRTLVTFEGGEHFIMASCESMPWWSATPFYAWVCFDPVWDKDRSIDLVNHFSTGFLLAELKSDAEAAAALAPENAVFPGIQYETTAYATTTSATPTTGYAEVNGIRLYYEMAGAGDPVVLLHGFGADSRYWQAQFEALAEKYQVIRYDLRGFGKSDLPGTEPYTHADDLKALMDYLGIERAHIIGHSFGGENAINFALAYPEATRSLILVDNDVQGAEGLPPSTPEEDAAWATIFAALDQGDRRAAAEAVLDRHPLFVVARTMPAARNLQVEMFADYSWWHLTGGEDPVLIPETPAAQRLGEITAPTLVIIGELDNEYQHVMVDVAVQGIPGAQKIEMPGLDHSPFVEDPAGFNQIVMAFLVDK